ncbi:MAG: ABC transporter permease subunit, partial [Anaerolineae bacterium]|nr:ABC transporter permease subunit [Anaerolineae bacterium]
MKGSLSQAADGRRGPTPLRSRPTRLPRLGRVRPRDLFLNGPLMVGLVIVFALLLLVLFGHMLAPENPYLAGQRTLQVVDGRIVAPPFPPGPGLPLGSDQWGRDILSMLLYGARNTLVASLFIATTRILLGWILGATAAWYEGRLIDRVIVGAIELTCSLPMLLTGVILILALDIRRGIVVFMAALCLVGWGEIAQQVRAEFMVVRRRPFIEGARVIGLNGLGIAIRHILPNVLPTLSVLGLFQMGAVLMILGELGFIGIFISGGTTVEAGVFSQAMAVPTIPEWGAMMADSRLWARSQPWMVFFPALAFFVAVLGFDLLGEGLRRLIQRGGVDTGFVFSKKMVVAVTAVFVSAAYIVTHVGPAPSYAWLARRFSQDEALTHLQVLAGAELAARAPGTPGAEAAAEYIAARFKEYGLLPRNTREGYFQTVTLRVVEPVEQPELTLLAADGTAARTFQHRVDFGEDITGHGGSGIAEAHLTFVALRGAPSGRDYKGLDLRDRIVMYEPAQAPPDFGVEALVRGAVGLLLVVDDVRPRLQLAQEQEDYLRPPTIPTFRITRSTADALLAAAGHSLEELAAGPSQAAGPQRWQRTDLPVRVRMQVQLSPVEEVTARNVLGVWPGSDVLLNDQLVIVSTHYDGSAVDPDGSVCAGASASASGVAAMLDIIRLWHEQGFKPRRTVLFAAWAAGDLDWGGAHRYLEAGRPLGLQPVAVLHLAGFGRGDGVLVVSEDGSPLADLVRCSDLDAERLRAAP